MFERLSENTSGFVITCRDDRNLASCAFREAVTFSIDQASKYQARDIRYNPLNTVFEVNGQRFGLPLPGRHNLYNALACIAFLSELGAAPEKVASALSEFEGIERRFDIHLKDGRHLVVDDYAHNPHKISSLIKTMKGISRSVCYIFQPHGFGPTRMMKEGYVRAFSEGLRDQDHLLLLPIYYAGGTAAKDISSRDIADGVTASGKSAEVIGRQDIFAMPVKWDSYVVFGARDDTLSGLAGEIAEHLKDG